MSTKIQETFTATSRHVRERVTEVYYILEEPAGNQEDRHDTLSLRPPERRGRQRVREVGQSKDPESKAGSRRKVQRVKRESIRPRVHYQLIFPTRTTKKTIWRQRQQEQQVLWMEFSKGYIRETLFRSIQEDRLHMEAEEISSTELPWN